MTTHITMLVMRSKAFEIYVYFRNIWFLMSRSWSRKIQIHPEVGLKEAQAPYADNYSNQQKSRFFFLSYWWLTWHFAAQKLVGAVLKCGTYLSSWWKGLPISVRYSPIVDQDTPGIQATWIVQDRGFFRAPQKISLIYSQ